MSAPVFPTRDVRVHDHVLWSINNGVRPGYLGHRGGPMPPDDSVQMYPYVPGIMFNSECVL
jgi:hypothetical protein